MTNRYLKLLFAFLLLILFFTSTKKTFAQSNSFITIVNPVRVSSYVKDPAKSLDAEYQEIKRRNLPATWLLTYDVLSRDDMMKVVSTFDVNQEIGIFLEVSPSFAQNAGVTYNKRDSWHRAASLFLSGYLQADRKKLIDAVFSKFQQRLGFTPVSVGSWWTDSYSLNYLSNKYKVTSNLSVSDQFTLDGYQVWGTYWSTPYYPSKINAAVPAKSISDNADVLMLKWAPRDPVNGYKSPTKVSSGMYSVQDYDTIHLPDSYFQQITSFYSQQQPENKFAHLTLGLESDFPPSSFSSLYAKRLDMVSSLSGRQILTMKDFTNWYRVEFKTISPPQLIVSDDFLGSAQKAIWYQNPNYRIGLLYDSKTEKVKMRDLRVYFTDLKEPFYSSPNKQDYLFITLPYIVDAVIEPKSEIDLACGKYIFATQNSLRFDKCSFDFSDKSIKIVGKVKLPKEFLANPNLKFSSGNDSTTIFPEYLKEQSGVTVEKIGFRIPFTVARRLPIILINFAPAIFMISILLILFLAYKFLPKPYYKFIILMVLISAVVFFASRQKLYVSEDEMAALSYLSRQPGGTVLVYDKDCLRCVWQTPQEPAAMAGYKGYVSRFSDKLVVKSLALPLAKSPEDIKAELKRVHAKYVYLTKYEDYIESLPYPPEILGLGKAYESANAQIWRVK